MMSLLLPLALLAFAVWTAFRIAASPTYLLLSHLFGGWADRCRHGPDLAEDEAA